MPRWPIIGAVLALAAAALAAAGAQQTAAPAPALLSAKPGFLQGGYLSSDATPDSNLLLPPPPAAGSGAMARDEEAMHAAVALRGTPRWDQAMIDADLSSPAATDVFSCAAGFRIGAAATPRLDALLRKQTADLARAVYPTKRKYMRPRPFMANGQPSCTPQSEAGLRQDGSYPSGHSAIGYGWGLVLAELVPDRAARLVARGRAFGDSRRVCNVHWLSDVEEGRVVATAVVARLHADPAFRADLDAARHEVEIERLKKSAAPDCARENAALANG